MRLVTVEIGKHTIVYDDSTPILTRPLEALGTRYYYGGGDMRFIDDEWPHGETKQAVGEIIRGYDCSGYVLSAWWVADLLNKHAEYLNDYSVSMIANYLVNPIEGPTIFIRPGDVFIYKNGDSWHIMLYIGRGMLVGATGGRSSTKGQLASACVQARPINYRVHDLLVVGTLKTAYRAGA